MEQHNFNMDQWITHIHQLQDDICASLEALDTIATFMEDKWERPEGGGGKTRVMANGSFMEKGGVNTSHVYGAITDQMRTLVGDAGTHWAAAGLSMVLHPMNPNVPTFHANWRYFELYDAEQNVIDAWFGGGMDLTPYYLFDEDATSFHTAIKDSIAPFGADLYPRFKKTCDEYFNNHHRGVETRGIGGIFYDHLRAHEWHGMDAATLFAMQQSSGASFFNAYIPIVKKRLEMAYTPAQKYWQEIRRGRYVEFNLIHDRGTIFGLKTNGRTESILMSLPATVRFDYDYQPAVGSEEARILAVFKNPKDWV